MQTFSFLQSDCATVKARVLLSLANERIQAPLALNEIRHQVERGFGKTYALAVVAQASDSLVSDGLLMRGRVLSSIEYYVTDEGRRQAKLLREYSESHPELFKKYTRPSYSGNFSNPEEKKANGNFQMEMCIT